MAFGEELGSIIKHVECPRCNAPAVVRAKKKESSKRLQTHIVCTKCHKIQFVGTVSSDVIALDRIRQTLLRRHERAKTDKDRVRIERKLKELDNRRRYEDLGL
jgi:ribosomal protein S27AE